MGRSIKNWSRAFNESVELLLELHREMSHGNVESETADRVRDSMERPWHDSDEVEKSIIRGLSADLYDLEQTQLTEQAASPQIPKPIWDATNNAQWESLLALLRSNETVIPSHAVSYLRGVAWIHLGQPRVAKEFLKNAIQNASNILPAYLHYYFYTLIVLGQVKEALPYAEEIATQSEDALLLLDAAEVFFVRSTEVDELQTDSLLNVARDVASRGLALAKQTEQNEVLSIQAGLTHLWLAMDYARSNDLISAYRSVEMAQRIIPNDPGIILVESWLRQRSPVASWDQGVGVGLIRLRGAQGAIPRVPYAPVVAR